jgi:hypothetical protein
MKEFDTVYNEIYKIDGFIGIYCDSGYGVYDNEKKLGELGEKFKSARFKAKKFSTYGEAFRFAQNGLVKKYDILEESIPPLRYKKNWFEWIEKDFLRGGW